MSSLIQAEVISSSKFIASVQRQMQVDEFRFHLCVLRTTFTVLPGCYNSPILLRLLTNLVRRSKLSFVSIACYITDHTRRCSMGGTGKSRGVCTFGYILKSHTEQLRSLLAIRAGWS